MMKVPLLDLQMQYATIRTEIRDVLERVCESQHFILGPEVQALEEAIAAFCGARFAIGMSSGTDALLAALMALEVGPGDEVITTPYSFFATAGVIARVGARPVFVDIDPQTFNLDSQILDAQVTSRTKAIIPVHLFGRCAEMNLILEVAEKHGLAVIEDAAQAIGARSPQGQQAGSIGLMGCFSFFPSKNLGAFGDGGMVVTNNEDMAEKLQILRVHGGKPKYHYQIIGGNFRLDALQAAILRVKLPYLPSWTESRRNNAQRYRLLFEDMKLREDVSLPEDTPGHIYNQFVVRVSDRNRLQGFLRERGIETEVYYPISLHLQQCFQYLGYGKGSFPHAETAATEAISLPIYPELTAEQQRYVVNQIKAFYQQ
jgi:dTDP-4-amino-4,6-dideoxygalactose transaminase